MASIPALVRDEEWVEHAACRGADVEVFFSIEEEDQRLALGYCARCAVRQDCLEAAVSQRETYGIWGGMLEVDRRTLIRDMRRREREARARRRRRADTAA